MEIEILEQQCGGTEFVPSPHRLHLGAQNAEGVDRLQFILPAAWAECTLALYLRRSDGVQLAAIPLDTDGSVTVDRRLTGSVRGQWMLAAMGSGGYTAYTRPGSYDVYATLPTDGGSEELPPSVYEQFVARVLESARAAAESARRAENGAADTAVQAALAQKAADKILADRTDADACAKRAEAAALRAESYAPADGRVLSVNGKGGAVRLTAQDVAAVPRPAQPLPGAVVRIAAEHHGNSMMTYFYRKAAETDPNVNPKGFRYPGNKPSTREGAIVMLADCCEAAVRSLGDCTREAREAMVHKIIWSKLTDGENQLSEVPLTLADISSIEKSFIRTFGGLMHDRIEYPEEAKKE